MKAYSIKYIETKGLLERDGRITEDGGYLTNDGSYLDGTKFFEKIGRDVFFERHIAIEAAKVKLANKVSSLAEKIKKLPECLQEIGECMKITRIRKNGKFLTLNQLDKLSSKLNSSFKRAGFETHLTAESKGSLNISLGGACFRINTKKLGYNARVNRLTLQSTKTGYKRTSAPTWGQREQFNHIINDVLDAQGLDARVVARGGAEADNYLTVIREFHSGRINDWRFPEVYHTGISLQVPSVLEIVRLAQAADAVKHFGLNAPWITVGQ